MVSVTPYPLGLGLVLCVFGVLTAPYGEIYVALYIVGSVGLFIILH